MPTFYEFFCGGGIARLGFGPGWQCLFANDIDPAKGASYIANFGAGELKVCGVAEVAANDLPGQVDCVWMSPPCVGFSEAGDKQGFDEEQSGAFWPCWRLIEGLVAEGRAPRVIAFENVTGLLTSHAGADIAAIRAAFERAGYRHATIAIDAKSFVPQSRPRIFIIGAREAAAGKVVASVAKAAGEIPRRNADLADVLDLEAAHYWWSFPPGKVAHHLAMLSEINQVKIAEARALGRAIAGPFARRMRDVPGATKREQRVEVRFDGLANALRVADGGGSSKQFIMIVDGAKTGMRAIQPREAARLMGMPDDYVLPSDPTEALSLCGDGVVVPVVRFLVEQIIEPLCVGDDRTRRSATLATLLDVAAMPNQAMARPRIQTERSEDMLSKTIRCHVCQADPVGSETKPPMLIFIDGDKYVCRMHASPEKEADLKKRERELGFELR
jgi:DNA (cytosine-5)-methyltransferase 1